VGRFSRKELKEALRIYNEAHQKSSETGDWSIWASIFTDDATYLEHAYGEFRGRKEIEKWITAVMAPFPHMTFPHEWACIDEEHDAIIFCVQNTLTHPKDPTKKFAFPNWTRVIYAGNGKFSFEEDIYNPARDAEKAIIGWLSAGGKFATEPKLKPKYR